MKSIDLIQPRHPNAAPDGTGAVYLPGSLLTAGARLQAAGVEVRYHDENFKPAIPESNIVGVHCAGAPYIPVALEVHDRITKAIGPITLVPGGRVIAGLSKDEFSAIFGERAVSGNDDANLEAILGVRKEDLPPPEHTSLIPAYAELPDEHMEAYLRTESSLYLSNGCKFACDFCAALRTNRDPVSGELRKVKEVYRDMDVVINDLEFLIQKALGFGIEELSFYLTNLDLFQTPKKLKEFALRVIELRKKYPKVNLKFRALATVESFLTARDHDPDLLPLLKKAGLYRVGYGIDGMTPQVWKAIHKGHNTEDKCLEAIRSTRVDFDLEPEVLIVFGHEGVDTEESLELAAQFAWAMKDQYGAIPRPHVAKSFIPGNNGWRGRKFDRQKDLLVKHPEAFQTLDFTALPSPITHPDPKLRAIATRTYIEICSIPGNLTQYLLPIYPGQSKEERSEAIAWNRGKFDI